MTVAAVAMVIGLLNVDSQAGQQMFYVSYYRCQLQQTSNRPRIIIIVVTTTTTTTITIIIIIIIIYNLPQLTLPLALTGPQVCKQVSKLLHSVKA